MYILKSFAKYNNDPPHSPRPCSICQNISKIIYVAKAEKYFNQFWAQRDPICIAKETIYFCSEQCVGLLMLSGKYEIPKQILEKLP